MLFFFRHSLCLLLFTCTASCLFATHNLAGQLTCKHLSGYKYELLLTTYTDPTFTDDCTADLEVWVKNGSKLTYIQNIPRENGQPDPACSVPNAGKGEMVYPKVKENKYRTLFQFPGNGVYVIRFSDPYRRGNIINIDNPTAVTFYVETQLAVFQSSDAPNSPPVLLNRPLDEACVGKVWTHNPGAYDQDGDSLAYELIPSQQYDAGSGTPQAASGYLFPNNPLFGVSSFQINSKTGVITWAAPNQIGTYNVAFLVKEYRKGLFLGHVLRDMVIIVKPCNNDPPVINTITDTCVYVGDTLRFLFAAYDPNSDDSVYLALNNSGIGNNGPFALANNPATLLLGNPLGVTQLPVGLHNDTIKGRVVWQPTCDNIRSTTFQVDFYAHDNFGYMGMPGKALLSANSAVSIHVIPPPPINFQLERGKKYVFLNWGETLCNTALGYRVYRKIGNQPYWQDTVCCLTSPAQSNYKLVATIAGWENTEFTDSLKDVYDLFEAPICYMVTAIYGGNLQNPELESCATNKLCVEFRSDPLYITNDSVRVTDIANGQVFVAWSKPDTIDTFFPPPYKYALYRAYNNQYPAIKIAEKTLDDTTYVDVGLNTKIRGYNYRVEVLDSTNSPIVMRGARNVASSIYLKTAATLGVVYLSWILDVPWGNVDFEVFRAEDNGDFQYLTTVPSNASQHYTYTDLGLNPASKYSYFVRSKGSHNIAGVKPLLLNDSNIASAYPMNDVPPCTPLFTAQADCNAYNHYVQIIRQTEDCHQFTDYLSLQYATNIAGPYVEVQQIDYQNLTNTDFYTFNFINQPDYFSGCYRIVATNIYGTTSKPSPPLCLDFCPLLTLPNTFTPNSDGIHDLFVPMEKFGVDVQAVEVYDRWGVLLHSEKASDIAVLWDGKMDGTGKESASGVYYYVIQYEEKKMSGNLRGVRKGFVMLWR